MQYFISTLFLACLCKLQLVANCCLCSSILAAFKRLSGERTWLVVLVLYMCYLNFFFSNRRSIFFPHSHEYCELLNNLNVCLNRRRTPRRGCVWYAAMWRQAFIMEWPLVRRARLSLREPYRWVYYFIIAMVILNKMFKTASFYHSTPLSRVMSVFR